MILIAVSDYDKLVFSWDKYIFLQVIEINNRFTAVLTHLQPVLHRKKQTVGRSGLLSVFQQPSI